MALAAPASYLSTGCQITEGIATAPVPQDGLCGNRLSKIEKGSPFPPVLVPFVWGLL